jgi:hypothetical protein
MRNHVLGALLEARSALQIDVRASVSAADSRLSYGGSLFRAASALPLDAGLGRPGRLGALVAAAFRDPRGIGALALLVLRTPCERPRLSASAVGREVRAYLNERFLGVFPQNRLCRGVLLLPATHERYLCGRRRQALRTNLRRAAAAGIRCETIDDAAEAIEGTAEVLRDREAEPMSDAMILKTTSSWSKFFSRPETTVMVARDSDQRARAVMAMLIDDTICVVRVSLASRHDARWALHDHLVATLIARRVRYLLVDGTGPFGALGYSRQVQHYQRLLGYELRHLIPRPEQRSSRAR